MVKFYEQTHTHAYPFETVTLGWFLRYPNPFSTHVVSTDTIERHFDPETQRLYTCRLHLKKSKIPTPILKLVPLSLLGVESEDGQSQTYILERSVVDIKDGVMVTESRNLELTDLLTAYERQCYRRPHVDLANYFDQVNTTKPFRAGFKSILPETTVTTLMQQARRRNAAKEETDVTTKVELVSKFGQARARLAARRAALKENSEANDEDVEVAPAKVGFFARWGQGSIQRSIEAIGLRRTERAVPKSKEGMNVVLERLRHGGLVAVLEGMKRDRASAIAAA